jgi:hypothetical protein
MDMFEPCRNSFSSCLRRGDFAHQLIKLGKQQLLWRQREDARHRSDPSHQKIPYGLPGHSLEYNISHRYDTEGNTKPNYEVGWKTLFDEPLPNPVFLFEINQLGDANATTRDRFRRDLADFMGISPDGYHQAQINSAPGMTWDNGTQARLDARKIRICDGRHDAVRAELMRSARASSVWIRETFLLSPGVYASRDSLDEHLERWMHDPCEVSS